MRDARVARREGRIAEGQMAYSQRSRGVFPHVAPTGVQPGYLLPVYLILLRLHSSLSIVSFVDYVSSSRPPEWTSQL